MTGGWTRYFESVQGGKHFFQVHKISLWQFLGIQTWLAAEVPDQRAGERKYGAKHGRGSGETTVGKDSMAPIPVRLVVLDRLAEPAHRVVLYIQTYGHSHMTDTLPWLLSCYDGILELL